jgi:hypothetical protein
MRCRLPACLGVVFLAAYPASVAADPITIFLDVRAAVAVINSGDGTGDHRSEQVGDAAIATQTRSTNLNTGVSQATMASSIADPAYFVATGTASALMTGTASARAAAVGAAHFTVGFELDAPHTFDFSGVFSNSGNQPELGTGNAWTALLHDRLGTVMFAHDTVDVMRDPGSTLLRHTGLLEAGRRWFLWSSRVRPASSSRASAVLRVPRSPSHST